MREVIRARPLNCDPKVHNAGGNDERCPRCNQWHLRPAYCQALDPLSPGYKGVTKPVTITVTEPQTVTLNVTENVTTVTESVTALTPAERAKRYRERKKLGEV